VSNGSLTLDGRYILGELLGNGRCGDVYRSWDRLTCRHVALKWATADDTHAGELRENNGRLTLESRILRSASSRHIVRVLDDGSVAGRQFLVMELATGGTLGARLRSGFRGDPWSTAEVGRSLAGGLEHIHALGFVHRDIEPGNLLIADGVDDPDRLIHHDQERILVADLGIAVVSGDTRTGRDTRQGTRLYRSPEQSARAPAVTLAADVYGATAVIVSTLTGLLPPAPDRLDDVLRHLKERWQDFVATGMHHSPAGRFSNMVAWKQALFVAINHDLKEAGLDEIRT